MSSFSIDWFGFRVFIIVVVSPKVVIAADWFNTITFILDCIKVRFFVHIITTVLNIQSTFSV